MISFFFLKKIEMDKVQDDIKEIENDCNVIYCHPIMKLLLDLMKCIKDTVRCCF